MGTNYIVPNASPFKANGVSSLTPGYEVTLNRGTGNVTITDAATNNYVSEINAVSGDVQFVPGTVGTIITTLGGDTIVISQRVAGIESGARVLVTASAGEYTINFV